MLKEVAELATERGGPKASRTSRKEVRTRASSEEGGVMSMSDMRGFGEVSVQAAYVLMCAFLQKYVERGGGGKDTLVDLLSSAGSFLWANGLPNDPVMWDDWRDAYAEATTAGSALNSEFCRAQVNLSDGHLALLDAFSVMMVFLEGIFDRSGEDLQLFEVVGRLMSPLSDSGCLNDSSVWVEWVGSVGKVRA